MTKNENKICMKALEVYGEDQINICIEEMSELTKELCKYKRGRKNREQLAEEIADVKITLAQMQMLFDCTDEVQEWIAKKLRRLEGRLWDSEA